MTYAETTGHPADFQVRYRFLSAEEGGRHTGTPFQRYRCDWSYEGDDPLKGIYMIYPEFMAEDGSVFPEGVPVPVSGLATMWILSHDLRVQIHRERIREGVRGYFMEGARRVAEAVVTRVIGLHANTDAARHKRAEPTD